MLSAIDRLILVATWVALGGTAIYAYSMFVYPWFNGGWGHVQAVWLEWQALNVGIIAFVSSLIAFNISRYHAARQRERELVAARSFLPEALSELVAYFRGCARLLLEAYGRVEHGGHSEGGALPVGLPDIPINYREVFGRCISLADPKLAEYLSYILMCLQVHRARLSELASLDGQTISGVIGGQPILVYIFRLGELQALVNNIFSYARGEEGFSAKALDWESLRNAYGNLGVRPNFSGFRCLEEFTMDVLRRNRRNWRLSN